MLRLPIRFTRANAQAVFGRLSSLCAVAALLCACAAPLPDATHIQAQNQVAALRPQVQSENGTLLSANRSRSLLASRLQNTHQNLDSLAILERSASSAPIVDGNALQLLFDGPQTISAMEEAIRNARDSINFETYIFNEDELGDRFANLLIEKRQQGVQVNVMYDSIGALTVPRAFFDKMRAAGISVVEFNPVNPLKRPKAWSLNHRDHRKILVVDGQIAFVGGVNISADYASGSGFGSSGAKRAQDAGAGWRDTHLRIEGPAVQYVQLAFLAGWASQNAEDLSDRNYFPALKAQGNQLLKVVASTPDSQHEIYREYMIAIHNAQKAIHITTPYFSPNDELVDELIAAAKRGVEVQLLFPSVSDSALVFQASQSYYERLLEGGVKIYQLQKSVLHAKTATIDGYWSTVGSANLDWRSFTLNNEVNVIIFGNDFARQMEGAFQEDVRHSTLVTPESWRKRPLWNRIKERAARVLAPLL